MDRRRKRRQHTYIAAACGIRVTALSCESYRFLGYFKKTRWRASMKKLLIAAAGLAAFAAPALAADMAVKAPPPVVSPAYDWTGFYVGANGGYGWSGDVGPIAYTDGIPQTFITTGTTFNDKGGFGGAQAGYNKQMGHFVLGVETDIQAASIRSSISGGVTGFGDLYEGTRKLDYFGTVRGRAGLAFNQVLFYVTGGLLYGQLSTSTDRTNTPGFPWIANSSSQTGYAAGAGIEYAFARVWSVKAEYQYLDFGNKNLSGIYVNFPGGLTIQSNNLAQHYNTVRVGLNYHFGGPVVAKY
jgi:outer membrane immunogenic protein